MHDQRKEESQMMIVIASQHQIQIEKRFGSQFDLQSQRDLIQMTEMIEKLATTNRSLMEPETQTEEMIIRKPRVALVKLPLQSQWNLLNQ